IELRVLTRRVVLDDGASGVEGVDRNADGNERPNRDADILRAAYGGNAEAAKVERGEARAVEAHPFLDDVRERGEGAGQFDDILHGTADLHAPFVERECRHSGHAGRGAHRVETLTDAAQRFGDVL